MRKITKTTIALSLLLLNIGSHAGLMGSTTEGSAFKVYVPDLQPGLEFSASALFLQPGADNLGWAAITTVLPITTPNWHVRSFNPSFQTGFNVGARYVFQHSGTDLQLSWSHLHTGNTNSVHVDPDSQWVSPFSQTGTPPTNQGQITGVSLLKVAHARLNFDYDAVNLDVGKYVNFGDDLQTRFFMGVSSAWINEKIISTFNGLPLPKLSFNNTTHYLGVGPRLGLLESYSVYRGFHLVGQLAGSLLYGSMQPAQYRFKGSSADLALVGISVNREGIESSSVDKLVPAVDGKLGISYLYLVRPNTDLTLEIGYMGTLYINPLSGYETNTNVIAIDTGSLSTSSVRHIQSNFSVNGPYMTARLRY